MSKRTFNNSLRAAAQAMKDDARAIRWRDDPVAWAEDVLGVIFWSKQKEILYSLAKNKRTAVKSSHSIGKTFVSAVAACWWISTRYDASVQSTAPTYKQVHGLLWEEIRKMHEKAQLRGRTTLGDEWLAQNGKKEMLVGEGKKPADTNIHGFQGTHRPDGVLAILDEACGLAETIFTGARAITTAEFDRTLAVGNPDDPATEFGRIFREGKNQWNLITVSAYSTPNFTPEGDEMRAWAEAKDLEEGDPTHPWRARVEQLLGGLPQPEGIQEMLDDWGKDSPRALSKVFAEFPKTSIDSLFTANEIEKGVLEDITPSKFAFRVFGVDVARYGTDNSVICQNVGGKIDIVAQYSTMDTMELAANIHKLAIDREIDQVRIDGVGVGGGVIDRVIQLANAAGKPYTVVEMTAQSNPPDKTLHRNARAYWYDSLKHQLRASRIDLPNDESAWAKQLQLELGSVHYKLPGGVLQIESKEDIRSRGDKSPDFTDALVMSAAPINYIENDPLADKRKGQVVSVDVLDDIETVSPY
jgi:hypothetical protein